MRKKIKTRDIQKALLELAIARNPHLDGDNQQELYNALTEELASLTGEEMVDKGELDKAGMAALKSQLKKNSRFIVAK